jgi:hypothetical protein
MFSGLADVINCAKFQNDQSRGFCPVVPENGMFPEVVLNAVLCANALHVIMMALRILHTRVGGVGTTWHLRKLPHILINFVSTFPSHTVIYKQFFKFYIITIASTVDTRVSPSVTANAVYSTKPEAV